MPPNNDFYNHYLTLLLHLTLIKNNNYEKR
jgi:hypothetical protein